MYIVAFIFFILGIIILITKELSNNRGIRIDLSENNLYLIFGIFLILYSLYILFLSLKKNDKITEQKYTKCPKCKEVFTYNELKEGKCKFCKDIETIDIEEYYKIYPKEKDS